MALDSVPTKSFVQTWALYVISTSVIAMISSFILALIFGNMGMDKQQAINLTQLGGVVLTLCLAFFVFRTLVKRFLMSNGAGYFKAWALYVTLSLLVSFIIAFPFTKIAELLGWPAAVTTILSFLVLLPFSYAVFLWATKHFLQPAASASADASETPPANAAEGN